MRIGLGYDVHRLAPAVPLVLGGVKIPHHQGLIGWSDADVLTHAVMDALLGAAALGDIGRHFPPGDPQYKGVSSLILLGKVGQMLKKAGYKVGNVDATIVAEQPKLAPHIDAMRAAIAGALGCPVGDIGIQASTSEQLGFVGREEGMVAWAIAAIEKA
ncbi:MAG: 2-C-methyl-D-erythritol 2,4-cyclodiphosphate synthase [Dehalococcoidia bacterium]|nr:MAG: 2-C-methyl-D-erythritol 2,4-cyclodiphosphate synthase [Dehalococcoidia bacterium]